MSYAMYKVIHLLGVLALIVALAGMAAHAASGQSKDQNPNYRWLLSLHGLGALLALVGGFGLLARIAGESEGLIPGWVWGKLVLWLLLGGLVAIPYRSRGIARPLLFLLPFAGALGAFLANYKPF